MAVKREHILKTWPEPWHAVADKLKRFEVRKNDRCFQTGDIVILRRTKPDSSGFQRVEYCPHTGRPFDLRFRIGWMLQGGQFGIEPGYCVFSLEKAR